MYLLMLLLRLISIRKRRTILSVQITLDTVVEFDGVGGERIRQLPRHQYITSFPQRDTQRSHLSIQIAGRPDSEVRNERYQRYPLEIFSSHRLSRYYAVSASGFAESQFA